MAASKREGTALRRIAFGSNRAALSRRTLRLPKSFFRTQNRMVPADGGRMSRPRTLPTPPLQLKFD